MCKSQNSTFYKTRGNILIVNNTAGERGFPLSFEFHNSSRYYINCKFLDSHSDVAAEKS